MSNDDPPQVHWNCSYCPVGGVEATAKEAADALIAHQVACDQNPRNKEPGGGTGGKKR